MVRTTSRVVGAVVASVALSVPAFTFAKPTLPASKTHPASHPRPAAVVFRMGMPDTSPTVDPAMVDDEQNVQLAGLLYSGLVRLDGSYRVVPDAATWSVSRNHRTYTFYLRHGLRFNNGDPLTAQDFRFSINRSLSRTAKSPSAPTYLLDIQGAGQVLAGKARSASGIKVLDKYTLQITVRWPVPYFLMELTYPTSFALDAKRLKKLGSNDNFSWYSKPLGSGPYRLKSWIPNSSMILVRNKYFAGPKPSIGQVNVSFEPLAIQQVYQYVDHNYDLVGLCFGDRGRRPSADIKETNMLAINGIYMNMKRKPFKSRTVRRALGLALNRKSLVVHSMGNTVTPFGGFVPMGEAGYDTQLKVPGYSVAAARAALKSARYPGGKGFPPMTLYYADDPCNPSTAKLAQSIVKSWRKSLKINVDAQALTLNTLLGKMQDNSLDLYLAGWSADYPDPHDWLSLQWESKALNNEVHYSSRRFDALTRSADVTWDYKQRMRLYHLAQQTLLNDAAWIPLYIPHRLVFVRRSVTNVAVTGYGVIPRGGNWAQVQLKPASKGRQK